MLLAARARGPLVALAWLYACWLGFLATHEAGHVLHAWLSGGRVVRVVLPWLGFSRTDLARNPHPVFVAWGGVVWGCLLPLLAFATVRAVRTAWALRAGFFAGFCLIANGSYLAAACVLPAGDTADMVRHGVPRWLLVVTGTFATSAGLWLWHRIGVRYRGSVRDGSVRV